VTVGESPAFMPGEDVKYLEQQLLGLQQQQTQWQAQQGG